MISPRHSCPGIAAGCAAVHNNVKHRPSRATCLSARCGRCPGGSPARAVVSLLGPGRAKRRESPRGPRISHRQGVKGARTRSARGELCRTFARRRRTGGRPDGAGGQHGAARRGVSSHSSLACLASKRAEPLVAGPAAVEQEAHLLISARAVCRRGWLARPPARDLLWLCPPPCLPEVYPAGAPFVSLRPAHPGPGAQVERTR